MLSERFFDIFVCASGSVAGEIRRALARHNSLPGRRLLPRSSGSSCLPAHLRRECSHPALAEPVVCGEDEGAHSALN